MEGFCKSGLKLAAMTGRGPNNEGMFVGLKGEEDTWTVLLSNAAEAFAGVTNPDC